METRGPWWSLLLSIFEFLVERVLRARLRTDFRGSDSDDGASRSISLFDKADTPRLEADDGMEWMDEALGSRREEE